jgi:hypothetical protein
MRILVNNTDFISSSLQMELLVLEVSLETKITRIQIQQAGNECTIGVKAQLKKCFLTQTSPSAYTLPVLSQPMSPPASISCLASAHP